MHKIKKWFINNVDTLMFSVLALGIMMACIHIVLTNMDNVKYVDSWDNISNDINSTLAVDIINEINIRCSVLCYDSFKIDCSCNECYCRCG